MADLLTYPLPSTQDALYRFSSSPRGFDRLLEPTTPGGGGATVHVAVGKSVEKTVALLRWTFTAFPGREICLLHVHRPSPSIPTLLGKLPATQANPEIVAAFRNTEREEMEKMLATYLMTCSRSRVKATVITTVADVVHKGIVDLINQHMIEKLVIEATPCFTKGKRSSSKTCHAAKYAPAYCEICFVYKGKLIWTRQASASLDIGLPSPQLATACVQNFTSWSSNSVRNEADASQTEISLSTVSQCDTNSHDPLTVSQCDTNSHDPLHGHCSSSTSLTPSNFRHASPAVTRALSISSSKSLEASLSSRLTELNRELDQSNEDTYLWLLGQKHLDGEALEAFDKVKALEMAHSHEVKLRMDAEDALRNTMQEQEKLVEEKEKRTQQLRKSMRSIALLDGRANEADHRCEEVAAELKLIQASIATLQKEKLKLQQQKTEATRWLHKWRSHELGEYGDKSEFNGLERKISETQEFLSSDLEAATCDFSESFRIGQGGYGIVYKGEMSDRTIAIKKLHSHNMHRQTEFDKVVEVLTKLQHPHLVELIGVCPESWLLVYEYLPGGNLQNYLYNIHSITTLNWKTRAQIVADIASGLLFLHSFKPKKIIHGNLKPENLLLDSQNRCKISDYGDHMLTVNQTLRCPSFGRCGLSGAFVYTDPEYYRTGALTHKSDIYSFGMIILQLVTGISQGGLVAMVSRALSSGRVACVLDLSAGEWSTYVAMRLLELGLQFCELNSRDRPELTPSLVRELQHMPSLEEQTVPSFFLCPILREIMHDPQVAADGFTYEGEALHGWLENGHDTSPMTNLKLVHLNLTPNHSLRLAIQDWLANL